MRTMNTYEVIVVWSGQAVNAEHNSGFAAQQNSTRSKQPRYDVRVVSHEYCSRIGFCSDASQSLHFELTVRLWWLCAQGVRHVHVSEPGPEPGHFTKSSCMTLWPLMSSPGSIFTGVRNLHDGPPQVQGAGQICFVWWEQRRWLRREGCAHCRRDPRTAGVLFTRLAAHLTILTPPPVDQIKAQQDALKAEIDKQPLVSIPEQCGVLKDEYSKNALFLRKIEVGAPLAKQAQRILPDANLVVFRMRRRSTRTCGGCAATATASTARYARAPLSNTRHIAQLPR